MIDLEAIVEYYYALSPKTAKRYYNEILETVRKLSTFPEIGRIVPEFEEHMLVKYRELLYEHYRIVYRIEQKHVVVLRIIDGRRLLTIDFFRELK
jgi:toxin ParE1/3/4